MSKTFKDSPQRKSERGNKGGRQRQRNISVRAVRRDPPDLRKLSRALIELAMAEAAAEADDQTGTKAASADQEPHD